MVPTNTPFSLALSSPYEVIQQVFSRTKHCSDDFADSVSTEFKRAFPDPETRAKVPYLTRNNAQTLKGKTVRWKGMVQDNSMGNEIVLATLPRPSGSGSSVSQTPKCALYGADTLATESGADPDGTTIDAFTPPSGSDLTERAILYAAGLPGRSSWAKDADRRALALEEAGDASSILASSNESQSVDQEERTSASASSWGVQEKIPLPDETDALGVLLKIYNISSAEALQAGDVVEIFGIVDFGPLPSSEWATGASTTDGSRTAEEQMHPTLHVLFHHKLADVWSTLPIGDASRTALPASTTEARAESVRSALIRRLAVPLNGDQMAGEWLLLALIASIHTRKAPFALGHLSLRLHLPSSSTSSPSALQSLLYTLLPSVVALPLTLKNLNDGGTSYAPHSHPDAIGLRSGRLQLPRGTTLVVHESISEGKLGSHGLGNLESLQEVISRSELGYRFPFNPAPFFLPVDLGVILLCQDEGSEGQGQNKSEKRGALSGGLIKCDVDLLVKPENDRRFEVRDGQGEEATETSLPLLRNHLVTARRLARTLSVPASVAEEIQRDFVDSRSSGSASPFAVDDTTKGASQEDLLRQMDIARLLSASRGRTELTFDDFRQAKQMDLIRLRELAERRKDVGGGVAAK